MASSSSNSSSSSSSSNSSSGSSSRLSNFRRTVRSISGSEGRASFSDSGSSSRNASTSVKKGGGSSRSRGNNLSASTKVDPKQVSTPAVQLAPPPTNVSRLERNVIIAGPTETQKKESFLERQRRKERERIINQGGSFDEKGFARDSEGRLITIGGSPAAISGPKSAVASLIARAPKVGQTVSNIGAKAQKFTQRNRATRLAAETIKTGAQVEGIRVASDVSGNAQLTRQQRDLIKENEQLFNQAVRSGFSAQTTKAQEQGLLRNVANELSPFFGSRAEFEKASRQTFEQAGFSGNELDSLVSASINRRTSRGTGELLGQVTVAAGAERVGRQGIALAFQQGGRTTAKKSFGNIAKRVTPSLAVAGAFEGAGATVTQDRFRQQDLSVKRTLEGAGFGAISAPLIGVPIAGLAIRSPTSSKVISGVANFVDPLEKPGDILANVGEVGTRKILRQPTRTPVITPEGNNIFKFGVETKQPKGKNPIDDFTVNNVLGGSKGRKSSPSRGKSRSSIPTAVVVPPLDNIIGTPAIGKSSTKINNPIREPITVNPFTQSQTRTQNPIQTPAQTKTPANILSFGVPTTSFVAKAPPPFLPSANLGLGGGGGRGKFKTSKFFNELEQAFSLLGKPPKQPIKSKSKGMKKSRSQKTQSPFDLFDQQFMNIGKGFRL